MDMEFLFLNSQDDIDPITAYDGALEFVQKYMPNQTELLFITLPNNPIVRKSDHTLKSTIQFSYQALDKYLLKSSCNNTLSAFRFNAFECPTDYTTDITREGRVFEGLNNSDTLVELVLVGVYIYHARALPLPESLRSLTLSSITLGYSHDTSEFFERYRVDSGYHELVGLISKKMTLLVKLSLITFPFEDELLPRLSGLTQLRYLEIMGHTGDPNDPARNVGRITDNGCKAIARILPNLHYLNLSSQPKVTKAGIAAILRSCPGLREIQAISTGVKRQHLAKLVKLSDSLLLFGIGLEFARFDDPHIVKTIKATGGRCLLDCGLFDLHRPSSIFTDAERRQMLRSHVLVQEASERRLAPLNCDMYEELVGVDIRVGSDSN